jgi:hypothetical protein
MLSLLNIYIYIIYLYIIDNIYIYTSYIYIHAYIHIYLLLAYLLTWLPIKYNHTHTPTRNVYIPEHVLWWNLQKVSRHTLPPKIVFGTDYLSNCEICINNKLEKGHIKIWYMPKKVTINHDRLRTMHIFILNKYASVFFPPPFLTSPLFWK